MLPSFQPLVFFLIQNAHSPFCSLGFGTLGGSRRIFMLCLVVGLAQRPTGNSAVVVCACWFVIIILKKKLIRGVAVGVYSWVNSVIDLR